MRQKRCLTIQDYSCLGRCSLTVALPILSAPSLEAVGLPTAILSNHTAYKDWTFVDLSDEMEKSIEMWREYNHHFDVIYTGYLTTDQIDITYRIIQKLKEKDTKVMIDPACADNGKLYPGFKENHMEEMKKLLSIADMTCPNMTEACLLTDHPYHGESISYEEAVSIAKDLSKLGPSIILLTGVIFKEGTIGCLIYEKEKEEISLYETNCLPINFHGAGDSFCSAFVGAYERGKSVYQSVKIAHDFVHRAMQRSYDNHVDGILYGLEFEPELSSYIKDLEAE